MFEGYFEVSDSEVRFLAGPLESEGKCSWIFRLKLSDPEFARLVYMNLRQKLENFMEKERKIAYEHGWQDAKRKKRKQTFFSCLLRRFIW